VEVGLQPLLLQPLRAKASAARGRVVSTFTRGEAGSPVIRTWKISTRESGRTPPGWPGRCADGFLRWDSHVAAQPGSGPALGAGPGALYWPKSSRSRPGVSWRRAAIRRRRWSSKSDMLRSVRSAVCRLPADLRDGQRTGLGLGGVQHQVPAAVMAGGVLFQGRGHPLPPVLSRKGLHCSLLGSDRSNSSVSSSAVISSTDCLGARLGLGLQQRLPRLRPGLAGRHEEGVQGAERLPSHHDVPSATPRIGESAHQSLPDQWPRML
jgi:hypothetical protein